jgi:hypothetical protein
MSMGERSGPETLARAFLNGDAIRLSEGTSVAAEDLLAGLSEEIEPSTADCGFGESSTCIGDGDFWV